VSTWLGFGLYGPLESVKYPPGATSDVHQTPDSAIPSDRSAMPCRRPEGEAALVILNS